MCAVSAATLLTFLKGQKLFAKSRCLRMSEAEIGRVEFSTALPGGRVRVG